MAARRKKARKKSVAKRTRRSARKRRAKASAGQLLRMVRRMKRDIKSAKKQLAGLPDRGVVFRSPPARPVVWMGLVGSPCIKPQPSPFVAGGDCVKAMPGAGLFKGRKLGATLDKLDESASKIEESLK